MCLAVTKAIGNRSGNSSGYCAACVFAGRSRLFCCHTPRSRAWQAAAAISGSTGWHNSVRARGYLEAVPNDSDARTLKFLKSNYGPKGKPMSLRWQNGLFVPDLKLAKTPAEADAMFLTMLDKYVGQNRTVSANKSSTYPPKVFANDKASGGFKSGDLKEAMDRLLERGD